MDEAGRSRLHPLLKLALELGPLVLFFFANAYGERFGFAGDNRIFAATGLFIAATLVALAVHYALVRRLPIMPLVSAVVVVIELLIIAWVQWKYMATPPVSAAAKVMLGGGLVLATGILIGSS